MCYFLKQSFNGSYHTYLAAKKKNSEIEHKVGDYVVYPIHGVGEILEISKKNILGKKKDCYVLEIQGSKMKVMIPVDKAEQVRIRPIIDKKRDQESHCTPQERRSRYGRGLEDPLPK
ncbi:CarD transcriptional regulator [Leptospira interrogans serovar Canicola]|nr:CarD transcriptional regulator [Leptospira interrogans serovar Canicola]